MLVLHPAGLFPHQPVSDAPHCRGASLCRVDCCFSVASRWFGLNAEFFG